MPNPVCLRPYNFNPRSREGSDLVAADELLIPYISIHAPAREATDTDSQQSIR